MPGPGHPLVERMLWASAALQLAFLIGYQVGMWAWSDQMWAWLDQEWELSEQTWKPAGNRMKRVENLFHFRMGMI